MEEARKSSIDHRQEKRAAKRKQETEKVAATAMTPAAPSSPPNIPIRSQQLNHIPAREAVCAHILLQQPALIPVHVPSCCPPGSTGGLTAATRGLLAGF